MGLIYGRYQVSHHDGWTICRKLMVFHLCQVLTLSCTKFSCISCERKSEKVNRNDLGDKNPHPAQLENNGLSGSGYLSLSKPNVCHHFFDRQHPWSGSKSCTLYRFKSLTHSYDVPFISLHIPFHFCCSSNDTTDLFRALPPRQGTLEWRRDIVQAGLKSFVIRQEGSYL